MRLHQSLTSGPWASLSHEALWHQLGSRAESVVEMQGRERAGLEGVQNSTWGLHDIPSGFEATETVGVVSFRYESLCNQALKCAM